MKILIFILCFGISVSIFSCIVIGIIEPTFFNCGKYKKYNLAIKQHCDGTYHGQDKRCNKIMLTNYKEIKKLIKSSFLELHYKDVITGYYSICKVFYFCIDNTNFIIKTDIVSFYRILIMYLLNQRNKRIQSRKKEKQNELEQELKNKADFLVLCQKQITKIITEADELIEKARLERNDFTK